MNSMVEERRAPSLRRVLNVKLFSVLLILSPMVDVATGALLLSGYSLSLSVLFKGGILALCLLRLCGGIPKRWAPWLAVGGLLTALSLLIPCIGFDFHVLLHNASLVSKCYVAFAVIAVYHLFLLEDRRLTCSWVRRIFSFYCWFFPLSIIVPAILGVGFSTYVYGVGFKGFYFAGNDISIVLAVLTAISVDTFVRKCTLSHAICALAGLLSLLLLSTKTCLLMAVVIVAVYLFRSRGIGFKIGAAAVIAVLGLIVYYVFQDEIRSLYDSLLYKYHWYQEQGGTVISFLSSGRDHKFMEAFRKSYREEPLRVLLFGTGAWQQLNLPMYHGLIEMDFFDLLIWHGVLLTAYITAGCTELYRQVRRQTGFVLKFSWWMMTAFGFWVGHVLFSPMANLLLALLYIAMMCEKAGKASQGGEGRKQ